MDGFEIVPVGWVESTLVRVDEAPRQGDEGAPDASIVVRDDLAPALEGLHAGDRLVVVTWLHRADRSALAVHPRNDPARAIQGVFSTRSPDRPNPIGLHEVELLAVEGNRLVLGPLEAVDGTPVIDIKPVLSAPADR